MNSTTSSVFNGYVALFEKELNLSSQKSNMAPSAIPINFGPIEEDQYEGVCHEYSDGLKEIIIRKEWWDSESESSRRLMIFHELGHCSLGRDHNDNRIPNKSNTMLYPESIMSSTLMSPDYFSTYEREYYIELFTKNPDAIRSKIGEL